MLSLVADRAKRGNLDDGLNLALIGAIAILALRPPSWARFLVVATLQCAWFLSSYQEQALVHWYIAFVFHGAILLLAGANGLELLIQKRFELRNDNFSFDDLVPCIGTIARFLTVVGVGFAGLAKLNSDYFDAEMGCGSVYFLWIGESPLLKGWFPTDPWIREFAIYFSCIAEILGPILILIPRTRVYGLLLVWVIMFTLALNLRSHYFEFSGLFIAMSMFWLPRTIAAKVLEDLRSAVLRGAKIIPKRMRQSSHRSVWQLLALELVLAFMLSTHHKPWRYFLLDSFRYAWLSVVATLLGLTLWHLFRGSRDVEQETSTSSKFPHKLITLLIPLLFLANEITPYLGLGHRPTMTMASNGQFRPGYTNHLLFTRPLTTPWSRDIEVTRTNRAANEAGIRKRRHMAWIDLVDRIRQSPKARVEYRIAGQSEVLVARRGEGPDFPRDSWNSRLAWIARVLRLSPYRFSDAPRGCGKFPPRLDQKTWNDIVKKRIEERIRN